MESKYHKKLFNVEDINMYKKIEINKKIQKIIKDNKNINVEKLVSLCFLKGMGENTTLKTISHLKNADKISISKTGKVTLND